MSTVCHLFVGCDQPAERDTMAGLQKYGYLPPSSSESPIGGSKGVFGYALQIRTQKETIGKPVFTIVFP